LRLGKKYLLDSIPFIVRLAILFSKLYSVGKMMVKQAKL
jgi:hypothetical protein